MSVREKGRRKIIVGDKAYIWYVALDCDSTYNVLNIISEDKYLILSCPLQTEVEYVISKGRMFQNRETDGCWNRYLLPFHIPNAISPKFVEQVIEWSTQHTDAVLVKAAVVPV
jgi:hypothetical protein